MPKYCHVMITIYTNKSSKLSTQLMFILNSQGIIGFLACREASKFTNFERHQLNSSTPSSSLSFFFNRLSRPWKWRILPPTFSETFKDCYLLEPCTKKWTERRSDEETQDQWSRGLGSGDRQSVVWKTVVWEKQRQREDKKWQQKRHTERRYKYMSDDERQDEWVGWGGGGETVRSCKRQI